MTIEDTRQIDFYSIEPKSGDVQLIVCDHLDWEEEGEHLLLLQEKLNSYLAFIEGGELHAKFPNSIGRRIVIQVWGKFPIPERAQMAHKFYRLAEKRIEDAGFSLGFEHFDPR